MITEQAYDFLKQDESWAARIEFYNEVTAKHGLPLKLYRFKAEQGAMEEGTFTCKGR